MPIAAASVTTEEKPHGVRIDSGHARERARGQRLPDAGLVVRGAQHDDAPAGAGRLQR
jgi:hypothetical protein